ncbi:pilus assembly protein N-terminal domain-containing protein [Ideonella sp. A 288]|uniref:pilus assembly protein N-terminal domain-containing protein n=1 Tax=Ideonella sp. A 288 TaxID=1962181 RepID=UPI0018FEE460|nr:pilus assembly protein N-terminal domain-containing protein [Ideonella sp. A 288]
MNTDTCAGARPGLLRTLVTWLTLCLWALSGQAVAALSASTDAVSLPANTYKTVQVTGARGSLRASSGNKSVATVSVKNSEDSGATLEIVGKAMGSTTVTVKDRNDQRVVLAVTVTKAAFLTVTPSSLTLTAGSNATLTAGNVSGSLSARTANSNVATVSVSDKVITVRGRAAGTTIVTVKDRKSAVNVPVTVTATAPPMTVSPGSLSVAIGGSATVTASNAAAAIAAASSNTAVATVSVSSNVVTVRGVAAGNAVVAVSDGKTTVNVAVTVSGTAVAMTASPSSLSLAVGSSGAITASNVSGTLSASSSNTGVTTVSVSGSTVAVRAVAAGSATVTLKDSKTTITVPVTVSTVAASGRYSLIAWNDLGMHCMDGDYSVFSILPPYNNLHAQLVNATTGKAVTSGVTLTYEAVADPTGSINTTSAGKSNFWQWSQPLYGASPAADVGLTGFATPSRTARSMVLDSANGWFEASGVPITPFDDTGAKNFYPTVKVTAKDATGRVLASTTTVLPVSDEMNCAACHSSRAATETNSARLAAKPVAGWVNDGTGERDWKKNILRLHDEKQAANPKYVAALAAKGMPSGLYAAALGGTPTLCASCHASNALPGTGMAGIAPLTASLHTNHGKVIDPTTMLSLEAGTNRNACYNCHPGSQTKCLRGAMGDAVDASGNATMGCQACHGGMAKVGAPTRVGWLQQPTCQACHFNGKRTTSAVDAAGNLVVPADTRFATNANVPAAGFSLFRFSKGHGGMQCEACHGSTHAEYPSSHVNDNLQSIALQGYAGTIRECTACHATVPMTATGGPHGMHTIGQGWVKEHGDLVESSGSSSCAYCHGSDFRGTPLSQVKVARTYSVEGSNRTIAAGKNVGCYECHNGPNP